MLEWIRDRAALVQRIKLQDEEIESLRRMLTTAHDTLDRHAWQQRALGGEAKVVAESLRAPL